MPKSGEFNTNYPTILLNQNKIKLLDPFVGAKKKHSMQCLTCQHVWTATPVSKMQTYKKHGVSGCPECNKQKRNELYNISRDIHLEKLKKRGIEVIDSVWDGRLRTDQHTPLRLDKIKVRNIKCGHEFMVTPLNLVQSNVECGICGPQNRIKKATKWSKSNSKKWRETATEWQKYKTDVSAATYATYKKYKTRINPTNLPRGIAGIEGNYHLDHIVPKRFCFDNNIPVEVCAGVDNLQMIGWRENVGSRNHIKGTIPPIFFKYINPDNRMNSYLDILRSVSSDFQLFVNINDIIVTAYHPSSNRAIIIIPTDKSYANLKIAQTAMKALQQVSVSFLLIFEDEMENTTLIKSKINHYIGNGVSQKIHARSCIIRECDIDSKKQLLDVNHIQGNDNAQINYGAYYNDQLVAAMTFSKPRVALGQKKKVDGAVWELSRFCVDIDYRIPGIASKLLVHFQRNHSWDQIYSYADKRWSVGDMYYKLGFDMVKDNPPDYFYVIDGKRKHRWNYRKDIIKNTLSTYDPNKTEYENMQDNGFWRVWGCGTLKFVMNNIIV